MRKWKIAAIVFAVALCVAVSVYWCSNVLTLSGRMTFKTSEEMLAALQGKYRFEWSSDSALTVTINDNGGDLYWYSIDNPIRDLFTDVICHPEVGTFDIVFTDGSSKDNIVFLKNGNIYFLDKTFTKIK